MSNKTVADCSYCFSSEATYWTRFILEEVSVPVVGSAGLVGNLAAIVVLSQPDMKSTCGCLNQGVWFDVVGIIQNT